jgi:hypothetical protein
VNASRLVIEGCAVATVDPDRIDARFENGVLLVRIPKSERARPREIRVNTSGVGSAQVRSSAQSQRVSSESSQREGSTAKAGR